MEKCLFHYFFILLAEKLVIIVAIQKPEFQK